MRACLLVMILSSMIGGCAGQRPAIKAVSPDAIDPEKKAAALKLFKQGADLLYTDNNAALAKFDQARSIDPSLIAAHFNAGVALEAMGTLDEAAKRYEACLAQNKEQESCLDNLLLVKAKLGDIEAADRLAESYLKEFPEQAFAKVAAAKLAFFKKDYVNAEKLAREAIEREAENVEALYVMARIFYERKQFPAAKWVLKNALEVAPTHGGLHLLLGHTDLALGLLHDALDSYALAVEENPTDEALESYGLLLLKRGRVAEALPVLKRLSENRPNEARNFLHLGNAYMANKMFDEAKAAYLRAQELNPPDKDVNFNLGLLYFEFKPKGLPELDRLKTAQTYFKAYLEKPGLSKDRITVVNDYLKTISQKIELEEYAAESAKEMEEAVQEEEPLEEKPKEQLEQEIEEVAPVIEEEPKEELPPIKEEEKPKPKKKDKAKEPQKEPDIFEEEEDFFEDF